jgi:hypothetical protein
VSSVGELALDSIAACVGLHEGSAELGLVQILRGEVLLHGDCGGHVLVDNGPWVDLGCGADELLCLDEVLLDCGYGRGGCGGSVWGSVIFLLVEE